MFKIKNNSKEKNDSIKNKIWKEKELLSVKVILKHDNMNIKIETNIPIVITIDAYLTAKRFIFLALSEKFKVSLFPLNDFSPHL